MFAVLLFTGKRCPVENEALPRGNEAFEVENKVQHGRFALGYDRLTMCLITLTSFHCMFTLSLSKYNLSDVSLIYGFVNSHYCIVKSHRLNVNPIRIKASYIYRK